MQCVVIVKIKGIEIAPQCATEQDWLLGNNGNSRTKGIEAELGDIDPIDRDGTR